MLKNLKKAMLPVAFGVLAFTLPGEAGIGDAATQEGTNPTDELSDETKMGSKNKQHARSMESDTPAQKKRQ